MIHQIQPTAAKALSVTANIGEPSVSTAQAGMVRRFLTRHLSAATHVDPPSEPTGTALKTQFRAEDPEFVRQGWSEEIALRNHRLMGLKNWEKTRLVGFSRIRFE